MLKIDIYNISQKKKNTSIRKFLKRNKEDRQKNLIMTKIDYSEIEIERKKIETEKIEI